MKIIIDTTPKEIAELLKEIKAQPDITLDINKIAETMNRLFFSEVNSNTNS